MEHFNPGNGVSFVPTRYQSHSSSNRRGIVAVIKLRFLIGREKNYIPAKIWQFFPRF